MNAKIYDFHNISPKYVNNLKKNVLGSCPLRFFSIYLIVYLFIIVFLNKQINSNKQYNKSKKNKF